MDESQEINEKDVSSDEKILELAKKRFELAVEATREMRKLGDEDIAFIAGEQWPAEIANQRKLEGRPVLTVNRCPQMVRNVTNDQKLNRPSIRVYPADDKADPDTAEIMQGLIRQIENESNAEQAYDTAYDNAAKRSYGFWRIITEYESPTSFKQKILIKRIRNPNSVLLDPFHKEKDGSDSAWGFVFEDVPKDEYKSEYAETTLGQSEDWIIDGRRAQGWVSEASCRIAEYFVKNYVEDELIEMSNGDAILKSKAEESIAKYLKQQVFVTPTGNTRKTMVPVINWYKLDGLDILDSKVFPGQYIPIVPVYGDEHDLNGKVVYESVIRHSKDSQRMYNYLKSTAAETITLAPKSPYIAAEGQIPKEYAPMWKTSAQKNHAYLIYKPTTFEGQLVPPPQRQVYEPPVQAVTQAAMMEAEDLKNTSGITDAAMGNRSNEQSGVAIKARASQAQKNTFHLTDNVNLSIKHTGRILVDIIPVVYDAAQAIRILGEDNQGKIIRIQELFKYNGVEKIIDFSVGKYDVYVESGPGYATKRQEAADSMLEMAKAVPQIMNVAPDLIVKNLDWPGATDLADRLKKTVDPSLIENKDEQPIPPQVQNQMKQMDQMIQQLTEKLNESNEEIKQKKMELESRERIEMAKLENALILKKIELQGAASNEMLAAELAQIKERQALLDFNQPINDDFDDSVPFEDANPNNFQEQDQQFTGELSPGLPMESQP